MVDRCKKCKEPIACSIGELKKVLNGEIKIKNCHLSPWDKIIDVCDDCKPYTIESISAYAEAMERKKNMFKKKDKKSTPIFKPKDV